MLRKCTFLLLPLMAAFATASATAADTAPPPESAGTVINSAASDPSKASYWVFRTPNDAVAINIYKITGPNAKTTANLMIYAPDLNGFERLANIQVDVNGTVQTIPNVLPVDLVEKTYTNGGKYYEMNYNHSGTIVKIGALRFREGSNGRGSADVQVRFDPTTLKSIRRINPCDEPLVDDMGEEEELEADPVRVPLKPNAVADVIE